MRTIAGQAAIVRLLSSFRPLETTSANDRRSWGDRSQMQSTLLLDLWSGSVSSSSRVVLLPYLFHSFSCILQHHGLHHKKYKNELIYTFCLSSTFLPFPSIS
jgi:hypothetical protein